VLSTTHAAAPPAGYLDGFAAGREAGLEAGLREAEARVAEAARQAQQACRAEAEDRVREFERAASARLEQIGRILSELDAAARQRLQDLEADAAGLAFEAVCQVLGDQAARPDAVVRWLRTLLENAGSHPLLGVRMHEADLRAIASHPEGQSLLKNTRVQWRPDPNVSAGGCVIETAGGTLDARFETQLTRLRRVWADALAAPQGQP